MKKAVFIINSLQNGGAERVVTTQANYLCEAGVDVTIIFLRKWIQYELNSDIHTIFLSDRQQFDVRDYVFRLFPLVHQLNSILDKIFRNGDVVLLTSHLLFPDILARMSRYSKSIISVLHAHQEIVPHSRNRIYQMFIRWIYKDRQLVCVNKGLENEMRDIYHLRQETICTIWNPLDFRMIDRKKRESIDFEGPYILFCGRLNAVKRLDRLIDVFYKGNFYQKYRLVILGIGELEEELKKQARNYGIGDRVYFGGWEKNVYKWMKNASLFVLTSESEGFSMVLAEALYCGCRVVAVKSQGACQIMRGQLKEYLCGPSLREIAETMEKALTFYPENVISNIQESSVEKVMDKYLHTYRAWNATLL